MMESEEARRNERIGRDNTTGLEKDTGKWSQKVSRAALLKERAKSYRGPNYRALRALVRDRNSRYEGPEDQRSRFSGARVLKEARRRFLEEARNTQKQKVVTGEEFCCYALSRLAKAPLLPVPDQRKTIQDIGCAEAALASYNKQNPGAEYELAEAIQSNAFMNNKGVVWHHVNFTAKPKNNVADHAAPKLFFAELNFRENRLESYLAGNEHLICRCSIVDHNSSETVPGCGYCYSGWLTKMYHVVGFFEYGCFKRERRDPIWPCLENRIPSRRVLARLV